MSPDIRNAARGKAGDASNIVHIGVQNRFEDTNHNQKSQAYKLKPPRMNAMLKWERVMVYRDIFQKDQSLESLIAYEKAMAEFESTFRGDRHG